MDAARASREDPAALKELLPPVIVVPDGLTARGRPPRVAPEPSFAFRAVLDHVAAQYRDHHVLLSPANDFGCGTSEQDVARRYLAERGLSRLEAPRSPPGPYIDTRGNASLLRDHLERRNRWPLDAAVLVVTEPHARRARLCFRREGYEILRVADVGFDIPEDEQVPPRLWFHRSRGAHRLYEAGATLRDALRPGRH